MVFLIILGVLIGIIALILLLPIGADIGYEQGKIHVYAKAGGLTIKLFPRKKQPESDEPKPPKKKKEKKPKKPKEEKPEEDKPKAKKKPDITFDEILNKGFDDRNFLLGLCSHFRDLLVSKDPRTLKLLEVSDKTKQHYMEQVLHF